MYLSTSDYSSFRSREKLRLKDSQKVFFQFGTESDSVSKSHVDSYLVVEELHDTRMNTVR